LSISDDGNGIPEGDLRRVFEPFFTTNRVETSGGLGLTLVYNIVRNQLGGNIKCESVFGSYKVIISDDDPEVHTITKMILKNFEFEGYSLEIIDTFTGHETKEVLRRNPDAAILFQDVVMEDNHTGFIPL